MRPDFILECQVAASQRDQFTMLVGRQPSLMARVHIVLGNPSSQARLARPQVLSNLRSLLSPMNQGERSATKLFRPRSKNVELPTWEISAQPGHPESVLYSHLVRGLIRSKGVAIAGRPT
jgi:hypothetical protein